MATRQLSLRKIKDESERDPFANRMLLGGCLLMLAPLVVVLLAFGYLAAPFIYTVLPRGYQPIASAADDEALLIITTLDGTGGDNPSIAIDEAVESLFDEQTFYSYSVRSGRLLRTPTTQEEALAIAEEYTARAVMWGSYDSSDMTLHVTLRDQINLAEPDELTFTLDRNATQGEINQVAYFMMALLEIRNSVYYYGNYATVQDWLNRLPSSSNLVIDPLWVAYYQAEADRLAGNSPSAQIVVSDALGEYGDDLSLLLLQALIYRDSFALEEAVESVDKALELEPDYIPAYQLRAQTHRLAGDYAAAVADFDRVIDAEPENTEALIGRADTYEQLGDFRSAIEDYDRLIELTPNNYELYLTRARLNYENDQVNAALDDFDAALEAANSLAWPEDALVYVHRERADVYLELERYEEALEDYEYITSVYPWDTSYVISHGTVYWEMGDEESARGVWEQDLNLYAYNDLASAYNNLAWELALLGYYEAALPYAEDAIGRAPQNPNLLHTVGFVYLGLGRFEEALTYFDDALLNGLGYDGVYRDLGDTYLGLKDYDQAIANYEYYLNVAPYAEDAYEVYGRLEEARENAAND